jgi:2-oxo-4-hydroxy-4-carboxy-5-ureidoimidazoline decarboxylase
MIAILEAVMPNRSAGEFMRLSDVNALSVPDFVAAFGAIAEHSPWVAERAAGHRPFADREAMVEAFQRAASEAGEQAQLALLRAHPDLAGRARLAELEPHSRGEQTGAGLDRLSAEEFARFTALNTAYRARFGFPFILAVKGAGKEVILASFESRLAGGRTEEFLTALAQVCRILRFRLEAAVAD